MLPGLGLVSLFVISGTAHAGPCDATVKKADTAKGAELVSAYTSLLKCDKKVAEDNFIKFMSGASDADTLISLSLASIDADVWGPVWTMVGKISSYEARDEVANRVGSSCVEHPKVLGFLQGAYFGLRDIDFKQWDDAFLSCEAPALLDWLTQQVEAPPDKQYDEKYNTLITVYSHRQGAAALPSLQKAAIKAAKTGPLDAILTQIDEAVAPELGDEMSAEDRAKLESTLVEVARNVGPDKARAVADRLASAGSEAAAARLLPTIYPDRVQAGGSFLYGGASVETADCKGVKTAVVHFAPLSEPGKAWVVYESAQAPLRTFKPKLEKCKAESTDPWPVIVSPEPLKDAKAVEAWAETLQTQWAGKGYEASLKAEKQIAL